MAFKEELGSDQRFSLVTKDPRFWEMPEKENKIKIDKRFRAMFHDKKFNLKYTVDKRGRPIQHSTTEDLKRFYNISESEESNLSDSESKEMVLKSKKKMVKSKGKLDSEESLDNVQPKERSKKAKQRENAEGLLESGSLKGEEQKSSTETGQAKKVNVNVGKIQVKDDQEASLLDKQKQKSSLPQKSKPEASKANSRKAAISPKIKCQSKKKNTESENETESDVHEDDDESQSDEESIHGEKGISSEEPSEDGEAEVNPNEEELDEATDEQTDSDLGEEDESDSGPDLARGRGNVETSSEDEDVDEEFVKEVEFEHAWGELDKTTPRGDQITHRLAVCNMDWDRLKAMDLLALVNSFKPKGGVVLSVKIYPSEFGKERLKQEDRRGPVELTSLTEDVTAEPKIYREKMREYQFNRLKYFYAVVECDSPETANKIYEECDGLEFESSCSFVDLRFIPDDATFDDEPKDTATDVDLAVYKPKYFTSAAMATSKVEITWDETDHDRMTALNKNFKKDEILDMDFQAYLASSSEEEEEEQYGADDGAVHSAEDNTKTKKNHKDDEEQIAKYKALLKGIQEKDNKPEENDMEMEIKWIPGLKESAEKMVKDKLEGKDKFTPWEQFLQKKKEKRKLKRKKTKQEEGSGEDSDELPPDVNFNDPYFSEELEKPDLKNRSKKNQREEKGKMSSEEEIDQERQKAEMTLLMMDDEEDGRKHFNYEKIVEQQNLSKKKKKQLMKKQELLEDDFQMDVADTRFQSIYTSHLFNVDPSDPSFRKTKAMEKVLEEKARRRAQEDVAHTETTGKRKREMEKQQQADTATKKPANPDLSLLIKSVKSKTKQFQAWKNKKSNR